MNRELTGTALTDDTIRAELSSCLKNYEAERSMRRRVRSISKAPINMLSTQGKRAGRIRELFR